MPISVFACEIEKIHTLNFLISQCKWLKIIKFIFG